MILSRTPFRMSFFGGGTDYPTWFQEHGGQVLSVTIDKYCYVTVRFLPPFFDHRHRIVWSRVETVKENAEIQHPVVRAVLEDMKIADGLEIHHDGDLPARSGLGSSSAFSVGFLAAINRLYGRQLGKADLAYGAIRIEQELLRENVGVQDQTACAFGGLNHFIFKPSGQIVMAPVRISVERMEALRSRLMLFFTGMTRNATEHAVATIKAIPDKTAELRAMSQLVDDAVSVLDGAGDLNEFGRLLHEGWLLKRGLASSISTGTVDDAYAAAQKAGAIGGKLLGAGGGGFILLFVEPEKQESVRAALSELLEIPVGFDHEGCQVEVLNESAPLAAHFRRSAA